MSTPLDAKKSVKKCLKRRKRKKKSRKKSKKKHKRGRSLGSESNSSQVSDSRSSSGGTIDSADSGHPFREGHRVKRLAKAIPGILTRHAVDEMGRLLVQQVGEESMRTIQPVLLRYLRLHVMMKNPAPVQKRELLTLGHALDRLLQRDILGAMDVMVQRVKAIELVLAGSAWAVAQNLELVPLDQELITSTAEAQGAAREYRNESKVQRELGKGGGKTRWQEEYRKKGDGKKGDGKNNKGGTLGETPVADGRHLGNDDVKKFDWSKFLQTRSVSYSNEEVRTSKWTTWAWANVEPALPLGSIGSIAAVDLAEGGVLDLLTHPHKYLVPGWNDEAVRASRVMVRDEEWDELARGLVKYNLCAILPESALLAPGGQPLLNGLFGFEKGEQQSGVEVHRLTMNLIPLNSISVPVSGDVATLPLLHQMGSLPLQPQEELVISSEDIRCFFYLFRLPPAWFPYLGFGKAVPSDLVRKDRTWPLNNPVWRVCLDNLDVLEKKAPEMVKLLEGEVSPEVAPLIAAYEEGGIPLNPKKSAKQQTKAEIQGADVNGSAGWSRPKKDKLRKYVSAALSLLRRARCSQKEIQIVGGGFVYFAMFRRPLMSCLNFIWAFIQSFEDPGPRVRPIPGAVLSEMLMFLCLLPLAHIDHRLSTSNLVTASHASLLGGGVCASQGETSLGLQVGQGTFRGEIDCEVPDGGIVCIVEKDPAARRVVESNFPDAIFVDQVEDITPDMCQRWAWLASTAKLVIVGAGPPCQSSLHSLVKPLVNMIQKAFSWCPLHFLQESVTSLDVQKRIAYTRVILVHMDLGARGIARCNAEALDRWSGDRHRFPPYQYRDENLLWHAKQPPRVPSVQERERSLGFFPGYTANVLPKDEAKGNPLKVEDIRTSLLGNTWSVAVVAFLLLQLLRPLKLCVTESLHQLLWTLFGGQPIFSSTLLSWHPLGDSFVSQPTQGRLVPRLLTLLSGKGSDIMIQRGTEVHDHQRFRASIPAHLWSWKTICGWPWPSTEKDHINRYELRAVYTALRWRVLRRKELKARFYPLNRLYGVFARSLTRTLEFPKDTIFDVPHCFPSPLFR
ncbi:unnamed protein product, partial [Symbiodinium sp. CCMP2456]